MKSQSLFERIRNAFNETKFVQNEWNTFFTNEIGLSEDEANMLVNNVVTDEHAKGLGENFHELRDEFRGYGNQLSSLATTDEKGRRAILYKMKTDFYRMRYKDTYYAMKSRMSRFEYTKQQWMDFFTGEIGISEQEAGDIVNNTFTDDIADRFNYIYRDVNIAEEHLKEAKELMFDNLSGFQNASPKERQLYLMGAKEDLLDIYINREFGEPKLQYPELANWDKHLQWDYTLKDWKEISALGSDEEYDAFLKRNRAFTKYYGLSSEVRPRILLSADNTTSGYQIVKNRIANNLSNDANFSLEKSRDIVNIALPDSLENEFNKIYKKDSLAFDGIARDVQESLNDDLYFIKDDETRIADVIAGRLRNRQEIKSQQIGDLEYDTLQIPDSLRMKQLKSYGRSVRNEIADGHVLSGIRGLGRNMRQDTFSVSELEFILEQQKEIAAHPEKYPTLNANNIADIERYNMMSDAFWKEGYHISLTKPDLSFVSLKEQIEFDPYDAIKRFNLQDNELQEFVKDPTKIGLKLKDESLLQEWQANKWKNIRLDDWIVDTASSYDRSALPNEKEKVAEELALLQKKFFGSVEEEMMEKAEEEVKKEPTLPQINFNLSLSKNAKMAIAAMGAGIATVVAVNNLRGQSYEPTFYGQRPVDR